MTYTDLHGFLKRFADMYCERIYYYKKKMEDNSVDEPHESSYYRSVRISKDDLVMACLKDPSECLDSILQRITSERLCIEGSRVEDLALFDDHISVTVVDQKAYNKSKELAQHVNQRELLAYKHALDGYIHKFITDNK